MRFIADEGVDRSLVILLRQNDWDVFYVAESASSLEDEFVLELANSEKRILITRDKDFGEFVKNARLATPTPHSSQSHPTLP
jgi:predicted nuclease of predicted toxin-antitoxin system